MIENYQEFFKNNIDRFKGTSLCFYSSDSFLNNLFVENLILNLNNFNKYDLLKIKPENGLIKINEIRAIKEFLIYKPNYSDYKIVYIENIDKMKTETANSMLKLLEEPPAYSIIITTTNLYYNLLPTIKSRLTSIKISLSKEKMKIIRNKYIEDISKINFFMYFDYDILYFIEKSNNETVFDIINNIKNIDTIKLIENFKLDLNSAENKLIFVNCFFELFLRLFDTNEKEFIHIVERICKIKKDIDKNLFLKYISKLSLYFIRDIYISKLTYKWKYLFNYDLISFFGLGKYQLKTDILYDNIIYFNKMSYSKSINYNFEIEVKIIFNRLNMCFFKN